MREGWRELTLDEVCDLVKRGVAPKYIESGGVCVINQKCIRDHRVNLKLSRRHNVEMKSVNPERYIKFGDVLVNSTGTGTLGRVAQVRYEPNEPTTVDTHVTIVRPLEGLFHHEFFGYMMIKIEDEIASSGEGASGQTELSRTKLATEFKVSFPVSIEEQKCIVAILDKAFEGIDKAIANTHTNLTNARELFESYLNSVFTQRGEGWIEDTVGNLAEHRLGKMLDKNKNKGHYRQYLRNLNVQWFDVKTDDLLEMRFEDDELDKYWVLDGDLLICEGGYPGRAAIWEEKDPIFFQKALHRVRCKEPKYNRWLLYYLFLSDVNGSLKQYFTGTGIQHFTGQSLKRFLVPAPPVVQLDQLLEKIDDLHTRIRALEKIYQQKLTALKELKQSLLQKAFSGELTSDNKVITFPDSKAAKETAPFSPEFTAKILAFAYHRHAAKKRHNTFGHVKAQKTLHLVESIAGIDLDRYPIKDAAGPNDFPHMLKAEAWAKEQQFFEFISRGEGKGYDFKKLARYDELMAGLFATLKPYQQRLERVVDLIIPKDSRETELLATVHAAWNNLILDGCEMTDEAIISEAREKWHPDKMKIPVAEFQKAIHFIRDNGLVPDGKAKRVGVYQGNLF